MVARTWIHLVIFWRFPPYISARVVKLLTGNPPIVTQGIPHTVPLIPPAVCDVPVIIPNLQVKEKTREGEPLVQGDRAGEWARVRSL